MAQIAKLEVQTQIKSPGDKFYEIFRSKAYLIPKICPGYIKHIQLLHGDWISVGSIRLWTYVTGNSESVKDKLEAVDDNKKSVTFNMLEGEILKSYKTYKSTFQVITNNEGISFAKWSVEYEKQNEYIPDPLMYLEFLGTINKIVDAYLLKGKP